MEEDGNREQIGETKDIRPVNYTSLMGLGLEYSITDRLHVNVEPTFRYYLNSVNISPGCSRILIQLDFSPD